jgi:hypothetical protein
MVRAGADEGGIPTLTTQLTNANFGSDGLAVQSVQSQSNGTSQPQIFKITLKDTNTLTLTVQVTSTFVTSVSTTFTESYQAGVPGDMETSTLSVTLSFSYTKSTQKTTTSTQTFELDLEEDVTAAPNAITTATLTAQIAKLIPQSCQVQATRWYDQPVTGATPDPTNNNWWMRNETVTFTMSGGLVANVGVTTKESPLS